MKKLLTIICALSLIMAFSVPAMALDDIEDNNAGVTLGSPLADTNQATDDSSVVQDNDGIDSTVGDVASGNFSGNSASQDNDNTTTTNTDASVWGQDNSDNSTNDSFNQENGNTEVEVKDNTLDLLSHNTLDDNSDDDVIDQDNTDNDLVDQDGDQDGIDTDIQDNETNIASNNEFKYEDESDDDVVDNKDGQMDNDLVDQDGDQDVVDQKYGDNDLADNDMNDNIAAAAMGGFAIGISIDDIELNLAATTSYSGIIQTSAFGAGAANLGLFNDDAEVKYEGNCNHIDASVYENTGIQAANFTAGNFNNSANLNSVTMTVQY